MHQKFMLALLGRCRVWVIVTNAEPVRVYLFNGGVLPFGSLKEEAAAAGKEASCSAERGQEEGTCEASGTQDELIVNLWRNRGEAVIWSVDDLRRHLTDTENDSSTAFDRIWAAIQLAIGVRVPQPEQRKTTAPRKYVEI